MLKSIVRHLRNVHTCRPECVLKHFTRAHLGFKFLSSTVLGYKSGSAVFFICQKDESNHL